MEKFTAVSLLFLMLAQTTLFGQSDSLVQLPQVEVSATPLQNEQPGGITEAWKSDGLTALPAQSIADFLQSNTGIYLKTYGAGSLATTSIRGASAGQTAVIWNGFQIQSPMLGLLDWSLLPTAFVDEISLQHGGNSAVWGSGAMGGALLMDNHADFSTKKNLLFSTSHGSFGQWNGQAVAKFSNQRWASATRVFRQQATNDFPYNPAPGHPTKYQANAAMWQQGLMQEVYWRLNRSHQLGLHAWLQNAYREIPPTLVQNRSVANQRDEAIRTALHWRYAAGKHVLQFRSALFREAIHYRDEIAGTDSPSHFWTSITEGEWQRPILSKIRLQIAGNQTFTKAYIKYYEEPGKRRQSAIFASFRFANGPWNAQLDGRQEWMNGRAMPFTPSLGIERNLGKHFKFGAKLGRNFRIPTLNDLYWTPGGKPDIQPESGWSEELNARYFQKTPSATMEATAAIFNRNIKNWIQWLPMAGQPFWSASNIAAVWSRGIENRLHLTWSPQHWRFGLDGGYDYVRSTNQEAVALPKIDAGQQWFYVPEHQGFVKAMVYYKEIGFWYGQQFTGSVVTEFGRLAGYRVVSAGVEYRGEILKNDARFFLQVANLWNLNYQVIERRPMPGRTWQIGVSLNIKN